MEIKQDPITKLYCREDGMVCLPPSGRRFRVPRWTFGSKTPQGYRVVGLRGKHYYVHQMVCRAFNGLPPADKPFCDHINRIKDDNRPENLRWVDHKENSDNQGRVDQSIAKYGVRACEDHKAYYAAKAAKMKAQGLSFKKGPDGKYGWYPRIRTETHLKPTIAV